MANISSSIRIIQAFALPLARLIHEGAMSGGGRGEIGPKMLVAG
jgi:hypothetical protein